MAQKKHVHPIAKKMADKGIIQADIGKMVGVSQSTVSRKLNKK
jgi:predicted transcriptional regulator